MIVHKVFKKKYNQSMRKLFILTFCLALCACAGTRTIDGETTKNWVKIVSSKMDNTGSVKDVCFLFDLSFDPGTAYERVKNNPNSCLEQCCWYSENKTVDFYFNDGFTKDLEDLGVSRRYYPDHITITMNYASFVNRLSARASSDVVSKDGVVTLEFEDIQNPANALNEGFYNYNAKVYTAEDMTRGKNLKDVKYTDRAAGGYKTVSISGLNREELLAQARAEAEKDDAHAEEIAEMYSDLSDGEEIKPSSEFTMQVSPFDAEHREMEKSMKEGNKTKATSEKQTAADDDPFADDASAEDPFADDTNAPVAATATTAKTPKTAANSATKTGTSSTKTGTSAPKATAAVKSGNQKSNKTSKLKDEPMYDVQKTAAQNNTVIYNEQPEINEDKKTDLQKKLTYERKQAVELLKRFYGNEIDAYLRALDKTKKKEGQVLFTDDKVWQAQKIGTPIYKVTCKVNGKIALLGADVGTPTTNYPIDCGTYLVDLDDKVVEAKDQLARKIVTKKY